MSWKPKLGETGRVSIGNPNLTNLDETNVPRDDVTLEADWGVVVHKMIFKLVKS